MKDILEKTQTGQENTQEEEIRQAEEQKESVREMSEQQAEAQKENARQASEQQAEAQKERIRQAEAQRKANWNIRPYLAIGLTAFIVIVVSMAVFFLIYRYQGLGAYWKSLMGILQPILIGIVIAYLINPVVRWEEKYLLRFLTAHMKTEARAKKTSRLLSIFGAILFVLIILSVLLNMVIPELYSSIRGLVVQLPDQVDEFSKWLQKYVGEESELPGYLEQMLNKIVDFVENWVETDLLPQTTNILASLTTGVISAVKVLLNVIIGIIISVYVLMSKETFTGQAKKLVYALLPAAKGNVVVETVRKSNEIFGGFISGKILDSAIIGVLCFIGLTVLRMPYTVLVSVIVGVTNVIPFFGPYIGAIPSAALIMLADPVKGLYFIIFIIVLQQLDGNIIGPRILGESTGLNSFWVVFAILVGGGLFGFLGMLLGVPVFATIYYMIQKLVAYILRKKGLPQQTAAYTEVVRVEPSDNLLDYTRKEEPSGADKKRKKRKKR